MTVIWPTLKIRPDKPLEATQLEIMRHVDQVARNLNLRYFVAGALARVILLEHVHGQRPGPATRDVDFGVTVKDWPTFQSLKNGLIETGAFEIAPGTVQRLFYVGNIHRPWIDLVPFGGIEQDGRMIAWPPDRAMIMNVAGFSEAADSAVKVEVLPGLTVAVASLPSLAVLKLITWLDRWPENRGKDAQDFFHILSRYAEAGNMDRLYDSEQELMARADFDPDLAGAGLLGREAAAPCLLETASLITQLFSNNKLFERFTGHILSEVQTDSDSARADKVRRYLDLFITAFNACRTNPQ
ncbi:MAG: nucleotidyl transferase AbiEii/AbiGii toxin family protein [Thiobacillus sp.]|nr:nucleotidyl transferase AbiEii/AbiGii toxin family protein [Thiobacillus sp.]